MTSFKLKIVDFLGDGFGGPNGTTEAELTFTPTLGEWVSLDIPLSDFTAAGMTSTADINQYIISGSPSGQGLIFIDNVYFWKEPSIFNDLPVSFDNSSLTYTNNKSLVTKSWCPFLA